MNVEEHSITSLDGFMVQIPWSKDYARQNDSSPKLVVFLSNTWIFNEFFLDVPFHLWSGNKYVAHDGTEVQFYQSAAGAGNNFSR